MIHFSQAWFNLVKIVEDNRHQVMAIVYMTLCVRWAKNKKIFSDMYVIYN